MKIRIDMSTARPASFAILLLTLASACQSDGGGDDDSTLRDNPEDASDSGDPPISGALSDGGDPPISGALGDINCFYTGPSSVYLGMAAEYAILAKQQIAMLPISTVTGDVGISPAPASDITGFELIMGKTNDYATSLDVVGNIYAADYDQPTPDNLAAAVVDMEIAYSDAASRWPDMTGLGGGDIGGMTLPPGVYNWDADVSISKDLSLFGCGRDVWIFQIGDDLSVSSKASVELIGGAEARNVFWKVGGDVDIGPEAHFEGVLLSKAAVTLHLGASLNGRLLALTSASLEGSTVLAPE
jgi:hypothetical protein